MYTLDRESLKQFGVPEKFEPLFYNVFKGEDGGIYAAYGETMHLLAKNSVAYRIFNKNTKIPKCISNVFATVSDKCELNTFKKLYDTSFAFVAKNLRTGRIRVFVKSEEKYKELPKKNCIFIKGIADAVVVGNRLLMKTDNCYKAVDLIPVIEECSDTAIFYTGEKEFFRVIFKDSPDFCSLGYLKRVVKTAVNNLLELNDISGGSSLYLINEKFKFVAYSPIGIFKINTATGNVRCLKSHGFVSAIDKSGVYIFKNSQYQIL